MLQATTKEQQDYVKSLVENESCDGDVMVYDDCIDYTVDCCYSVGISFDTMAKIVDYLRQPKDCDTELFEKCWVAYKRKGIKKKALDYWKKLTEKERAMVLPHVNAYVQSRDIQYLKDFERYLRDKVFLTVVYNGNQISYDPTKTTESGQQEAYMPICGGALMYNDFFKCYVYVGAFNGFIPDGYNNDDRPDGARVMLNNGQGFIKWNYSTKQWEKE